MKKILVVLLFVLFPFSCYGWDLGADNSEDAGYVSSSNLLIFSGDATNAIQWETLSTLEINQENLVLSIGKGEIKSHYDELEIISKEINLKGKVFINGIPIEKYFAKGKGEIKMAWTTWFLIVLLVFVMTKLSAKMNWHFFLWPVKKLFGLTKKGAKAVEGEIEKAKVEWDKIKED